MSVCCAAAASRTVIGKARALTRRLYGTRAEVRSSVASLERANAGRAATLGKAHCHLAAVGSIVAVEVPSQARTRGMLTGGAIRTGRAVVRVMYIAAALERVELLGSGASFNAGLKLVKGQREGQRHHQQQWCCGNELHLDVL